MIFQYINMKGGEITFDGLDIVNTVPLEDQLGEDLLQISYLNGKYIVETGWYKGIAKFKVEVVKNCQWETPLLVNILNNFPELETNIQECIDFVADLIGYDQEEKPSDYLKGIDLKEGIITYNNFNTDLSKKIHGYPAHKELQISYANNQYLIDVGWDNKKKVFTTYALKNDDWLNHLFSRQAKHPVKLKENVLECIIKVHKLINK